MLITTHHGPIQTSLESATTDFILVKLFPEAHLYSGFKILSGWIPIQNIWIYRGDLCQHTKYEECKPSIAHYQIIKYNRVEASPTGEAVTNLFFRFLVDIQISMSIIIPLAQVSVTQDWGKPGKLDKWRNAKNSKNIISNPCDSTFNTVTLLAT